MRVNYYLRPLLLILVFLNTFSGTQPNGLKGFKIEGFAQGTTFHITYYANDSTVKKKTIENLFGNIDSSLSIYKPYSLINKFNNSVLGVEMDEHLCKVVQRSLDIYKETDGIFDISIYPVVDAWGFGIRKVTSFPNSEDIKSMLYCVGSNKIYIKGNWLLKDVPCLKIDVNGIAQGYSVDVIADFLESSGIRNYLVEIGGEIRVKGRKQPDGKIMKIGIEQPSDIDIDEPALQKIIKLGDGAITTSGNYRKYIQIGSKRISHQMDPKSGYPIDNELISVTVRAKNAIIADGYDNALMGMGLEKALLFLTKHKELEAYFIFHKPDGSVADTATTGFYEPEIKY